MAVPRRPHVVARGDVREVWLLPPSETASTPPERSEGVHVADVTRDPPGHLWVARRPGTGVRLDADRSIATLVQRLTKKRLA